MTQRLITPIFHGAITAGVIGWLMIAEIAANTPEWIAVIITIIGSIGAGVWWLSARLQRGDDTMKVLGQRMDRQRGIIEDHGKVLMASTESLNRIELRLRTLPCKKSECPKK
jgi:hypothetical protein